MSSTIIPTLRYRDAARMIAWLSMGFGFRQKVVHKNDSGGIAHAQLTLGNSMIMLSTHHSDEFGVHQTVPDGECAVTQSSYIVVTDPDAVFNRAKQAGARIVMDIADWDHGGRGFSCRDPEGQLWNFGSYDPWDDGTRPVQ